MSMLRRIVLPLLIAASAALSGCANLGQSAGFEVQAQKDIVHKRQEPWHNLTIVGDISKVMAYRIAFIRFPQPLPKEWKEELVDRSRSYVIDLPEGKKARKPLERAVFRALAYRGEQFVEMFDALITQKATGLFVLMPSGGEYEGINLVIVPSDATWLMTTQGEKVPLAEEQGLEKLPQGFFTEHPSPLRQMIRMDRADKSSKDFFADLDRFFPPDSRFSVHGFKYSGRPDARIVLGEFTRVDQPLDRVVSCGSGAVSANAIPFFLVVSAARNVYVAGKSDCFK